MLKSSVSHYTSSPVTHYCFKSKVALGNVLIIVSQEGAYCSLRECFSLGMPTYKKLLFKYLSSQTYDYLCVYTICSCLLDLEQIKTNPALFSPSLPKTLAQFSSVAYPLVKSMWSVHLSERSSECYSLPRRIGSICDWAAAGAPSAQRRPLCSDVRHRRCRFVVATVSWER